jgi:hypothetical protein
MNGRASKEVRKAAHAAARQTEEAVAPVLAAAQRHSFGLQTRVDVLEKRADALSRWQSALEAWQGRAFLGRLKWLLLGR